MADVTESVYDEVKGVDAIEGTVGMDLGVWFHFETDRAKITLKLFHKDAAALRQQLDREASISRPPQK